MGRVYLAEQQMGTATRKVAIKVLHAKLGSEDRVRKRFYRECEVVIQLTHPNTIHFLDFGEIEGRLFIVMEHVDGPTLTDELAEGPLPLDRIDPILEQLAGSLQEAHDMGVVHRDLKPDNVMLTTRGGQSDTVKVCDFGIAQHRGGGPEITIEGTVIGTPQYMSPEQLNGGTVDARSDVYSLGLMLFEMLTGERPFHAETPLQWAAHHTTTPPPSLDHFPSTRDLSPHRREAVEAALEKSADDRPQSARDLASAFLGRPVGRPGASESGTISRSGRPPSRIDRSAPTRATSQRSEDLVLKPAGMRSGVGGVAVLLIVIGLVSAGVAAFLQKDRLMAFIEPPTLDAGTPTLVVDAGSDAGLAEPVPIEWLRIVHYQRRVEHAANALGAPDAEYAEIRPRGTLVLELRAGMRIASDGTSGPDISIRVDDDRSGPYRADFGIDRNQYTTVGSELIGSLELDCDQFEIGQVRYIRLKNRGARVLYIDAVGVFATVRVR